MYGIGGLGKTTIAKFAYNTNIQLFEGGSFLENIRQYSEKSDGLLCLQRQLISDILKGKIPTVSNINDGINKIRAVLRHRKVLIVLDDVDRVEQLDAIFGMREWFYMGSKILITTRNVHLLNAREPCKKYAVKTMNYYDSLELFSWHAFGCSQPPECYIEHSKRIVEQCQRLPLALKVVGSSLSGKKLDVWKSAIEKLEIIPHWEVQKIMQLSYESLQDDHDRDLFLEIACFFNGEAKSYVVGILDECKYYTIIGIENLIDRCLLKIDECGRLEMHRAVQSMGRELIRQQSPREPGQRSRLWRSKDSLEVLKDETGTGIIEGLALDMDVINTYQADLTTESFSMMHKLKLLKINNVQLSGCYKRFPKKLKWLCWHGCPSLSLPSDFPLTSLVAVDMQHSNLETLWLGNMVLRSLKFLNLSHCHNIVKTPEFSKFPALERLILKGCSSLIMIDESIGMAEGLLLLDLKDCKLLKYLPKSFCKLKFLETLNVSGCSNLGELPVEMKKMVSLKVFLADGLDFSNSNSTTEEKESWSEFIWGWYSKPKIIPRHSLSSLPCSSITRLSLVNCNLHDNAFPSDFLVTPLLKYLTLSKNPIRFFPDCFKGLTRLRRLDIDGCTHLQRLEGLPNVNRLHVEDCPLLEKIKFQPGSSSRNASSPWRCKKLVEWEHHYELQAEGIFDSKLINYIDVNDVEAMRRTEIRLYNNQTLTERKFLIQGIYENSLRGKLFSIFLPRSSLPISYTVKNNMSSVSFSVSSQYKLRYLNVGFVYNFAPVCAEVKGGQHFFIVINNRTKDRKTIYGPSAFGIPEADEYMTWLSHWKFGSHEMESGDEVDVSILKWGLTSFKVKDVGIHVVYNEKKQEGVHSAKPQKSQKARGKTSHYVVPKEREPWAHLGTTRLYFVGPQGVTTDALLKTIISQHPEKLCCCCLRKLNKTEFNKRMKAITDRRITEVKISCSPTIDA